MYASPPRRAERFLWRTQCEFYVSGRRQVGVITNISRTGIFLQTATTAAHRGALVLLRIPASEMHSAFLVEAQVARRQFARVGLGGGWTNGLGLQLATVSPQLEMILQHCEDSRQNDSKQSHSSVVQKPAKDRVEDVKEAGTLESPADPVAISEPQPIPTLTTVPTSLFRVRVMLQGTTRSRMLTVRGVSADEARAKALAQVHQNWKVIEVAPRCS